MKKPIIKKDISCDCMKDFTAELQKSPLSLWLFVAGAFLFGVIVGYITSPFKNGVTIGCNNSAITYEAEENADTCKREKCKKRK